MNERWCPPANTPQEFSQNSNNLLKWWNAKPILSVHRTILKERHKKLRNQSILSVVADLNTCFCHEVPNSIEIGNFQDHSGIWTLAFKEWFLKKFNKTIVKEAKKKSQTGKN